MREFDELCEGLGIIKKVTRERYPREIRLSEEFLEALKKEYYDHKLEEDNERPVRNRPQKFSKALRFQIEHLENTAAVELEAMKARYASEVDESNNERVPEVTVDGEKKKLPQNDAPENKEPTTQTLDKSRRLVLKRNVSSEIKEEVTKKSSKLDMEMSMERLRDLKKMHPSHVTKGEVEKAQADRDKSVKKYKETR